MPTNRPGKRPFGRIVRPLGRPLGWSPDDVASRANVVEIDKLQAVAYWQQHAPPRQKELLRATMVNA